ncbi:PIR protein [Plasmodium ovale]|uniref:PIR protein n=1 Tax=Plasmodium ovale TaxID=36330 RepID=A0A1C3KH91_PLAOA|nr:PIR protein [Plasmodium ovale]
MTLKKDENYEFCDHFQFYLKLEALLLAKKEELGKFNEGCSSIENDYSGIISNSKDICAKFKHIATQFLNVTGSDDSVNKYGFFYLNFWLNHQLKDIKNPTVSSKQFYDNLKEKDPGFDIELKLNDKMSVIEKEHLNNMIMLRNLYENYNAIQDIINDQETSEKSCLDYPEKCTKIFEEANKYCSTDNINFCKALKTFIEKYEYMFKDTDYKNCKLHKPLTLTNYSHQEDPDSSEYFYADSWDQGISAHSRNKIVVIFTLISFFLIFLILYKATPFGTYVRSQIRRVKEKWINLEYYNENKSILQPTEYQPINEETSQLHIPYY